MIFEKVLSDSSFKKYHGTHFDESWYKFIITDNSDGYYMDNGEKKVLFKFRKNKINEKYSNLAINTFLNYSKKKHSNRGLAGGILPGEKNARKTTKSGQSEGQ